MLQFIPVVGSLIKTVGGIFESWQERKLVKAQGAVEIQKAIVEGEIKRAVAVTEGEIKYDQIAAEGMQYSWKDEWLTLLLSAPFIMCFIPYPPLQNQVKIGFEILRTSTPEWYQYCFIGVVVASFGLKTWMKSKP